MKEAGSTLKKEAESGGKLRSDELYKELEAETKNILLLTTSLVITKHHKEFLHQLIL